MHIRTNRTTSYRSITSPHSGPGRPTLRPLGAPTSIRVRTDRTGTPLEIRLTGRGRGGRVTSLQETWRIDDEWWRTPISRLYHRIVLENGRVMTIYRDLVEGGWYTQ